MDGASDGQIVTVAPDGTTTVFATLSLASGQFGLRQMAFSPSGFLPGYGQLLFVSVSGSRTGGGTAGDVLALAADGTIVASLRQTQGFTKFDPRGMFFTSDDHLLISDASDPIDRLSPSDFQRGAPVPEASTVASFGLLLTLGMGGLIVAAKRKKTASSL